MQVDARWSKATSGHAPNGCMSENIKFRVISGGKTKILVVALSFIYVYVIASICKEMDSPCPLTRKMGAEKRWKDVVVTY